MKVEREHQLHLVVFAACLVSLARVCVCLRCAQPLLAVASLEDARARFARIAGLSGFRVASSVRLGWVGGAGLGVYAGADVPRGTQLMVVPAHHMMSVGQLPGYLQEIYHSQPARLGAAAFAFFAALRVQLAPSAAELPPWLAFLQQRCSDGADLLPHLQRHWPPGTYEPATRMVAGLQQRYETLVSFFGPLVSFEEYAYAECYVRTRAFQAAKWVRPLFGEKLIVPLGDLYNHDRMNPNVDYEYVPTENNTAVGLKFTTNQDVRAGEQLTIAYWGGCIEPINAMSFKGFYPHKETECMSVDLLGAHLMYNVTTGIVNLKAKQPWIGKGNSVSGYYKRLRDILKRHIDVFQEEPPPDLPQDLALFWKDSLHFLKLCRHQTQVSLDAIKAKYEWQRGRK